MRNGAVVTGKDANGTITDDGYLLKDPIAVGTTWGGPNDTSTITSITDTDVVPAGVYTNVVVVEAIRTDEPDRKSEWKFAAKVGLTSQIGYVKVGGTWVAGGAIKLKTVALQ